MSQVSAPLASSFNQGNIVPTITCINKATVAMGVDYKQLVATLQQYANLVAKHWGTPVNVIDSPDFKPGCWALVFVDTADVAGALGYHDLTPDGHPIGYVFVKTTLDDGEKVEVTASHELAEMMVDPGIQMAAELTDPQDNSKTVFYAYEVADPVEQDDFVLNGIAMSNFAYPSWFESFHKPSSVKFDYQGLCKTPGEIRPGGYMSVNRNGQWTQIFGSKAAEAAFTKKNNKMHRSWRRAVRLPNIPKFESKP